MSVFIAVLRAINVGGTGKLPMKDLKAACEAAGLLKVETYIASGNLVFEHDGTADQAQSIVAKILREQFGLTKNHTIIRTPEQLAAALAANPFADAALERPSSLMLTFLEATPPDPAASAEILAKWTGPERTHLAGDHLYVDFVAGAGTSKLTPAYLERALKVAGTARNWNTANKLLEMAKR
ncbi:MAG TPA: DUF1697 domain-containing protein [Magnetospirillaceae bacterium]|nr:DUF1697 domain-containing protein [Magnetospirillaceae bacterium]